MMERRLTTAADADDASGDIAFVLDGWFAESPRIEWEEFYDRLDSYGWFLPEFGNAADKRVRVIVRELRATGGE